MQSKKAPKSSVFPPLQKCRLEALELFGSLKGPAPAIDKLMAPFFRKSVTGIDMIRGYYSEGKRTHAIRLVVDSRKDDVQVKVKFRANREILRETKLDDTLFLKFFRSLCPPQAVVASRFAVAASFRFKYRRGMVLPFNPSPKSPIFVNGVRYGFDERKPGNLRSIIVEKPSKDIHIVVISNPVFSLRHDLINEHFFDAVIDILCRTRDAMTKGGHHAAIN